MISIFNFYRLIVDVYICIHGWVKSNMIIIRTQYAYGCIRLIYLP